MIPTSPKRGRGVRKWGDGWVMGFEEKGGELVASGGGGEEDEEELGEKFLFLENN